MLKKSSLIKFYSKHFYSLHKWDAPSQLELSSINDFDLNLKSLAELKDIIFAIIDSFQDDLLEYATEKYYLAEKADDKRIYDKQAAQELEEIFENIESKYKSV